MIQEEEIIEQTQSEVVINKENINMIILFKKNICNFVALNSFINCKQIVNKEKKSKNLKLKSTKVPLKNKIFEETILELPEHFLIKNSKDKSFFSLFKKTSKLILKELDMALLKLNQQNTKIKKSLEIKELSLTLVLSFLRKIKILPIYLSKQKLLKEFEHLPSFIKSYTKSLKQILDCKIY